MKNYKILLKTFILLTGGIIFACTVQKNRAKNKFEIFQNKNCTCDHLKTWVSNSLRLTIDYRVSDTIIEINNKDYHKIKFSFSGNKSDSDGFVRVSNDTVFWLDSYPYEQFKIPEYEQIFLILNRNATSEWVLRTSSSLLQSSEIKLQSLKNTGKDTIYSFTVNSLEPRSSDYIELKTLDISRTKGLFSISLETSNGDKPVCYFKK